MSWNDSPPTQEELKALSNKSWDSSPPTPEELKAIQKPTEENTLKGKSLELAKSFLTATANTPALIDTVSGNAATRSALYAAQEGKNPLSAGYEQYKTLDSNQSPSGQMIAERAGIPSSVPTQKFSDQQEYWNRFSPRELPNVVDAISPSKLAGAGIEMVASPLPLVGPALGEVSALSKLIKGTKLGNKIDSVIESVKNAPSWIGSQLTYTPQENIQKYADIKGGGRDKVKELIKISGGSEPEAADLIRQGYQDNIKGFKSDQINAISQAEANASTEKNIDFSSVISKLQEEKNKLSPDLHKEQISQINELENRLKSMATNKDDQAIAQTNKRKELANLAYGKVKLNTGIDELNNLGQEISNNKYNAISNANAENRVALADQANDNAINVGSVISDDTTSSAFKRRLLANKAKDNIKSKSKLSPQTEDILNKFSDANMGALDLKTKGFEERAALEDALSNKDLSLQPKVSASDLVKATSYLQDIGEPSFNQSENMFNNSSSSQKAAATASSIARRLRNENIPGVIEPFSKLEELHNIDDKLNKNLITPGTPDPALFAALPSRNERNFNKLKALEDLTGKGFTDEAGTLSAFRSFNNPGLFPNDTTGKSLLRTGIGALIGGGTGHLLGIPHGLSEAMGASLTSPMALKLAIDAGVFPRELIHKITGSVGKLTALDYEKAFQIIKSEQSSRVMSDNPIERRINRNLGGQ